MADTSPSAAWESWIALHTEAQRERGTCQQSPGWRGAELGLHFFPPQQPGWETRSPNPQTSAKGLKGQVGQGQGQGLGQGLQGLPEENLANARPSQGFLDPTSPHLRLT